MHNYADYRSRVHDQLTLSFVHISVGHFQQVMDLKYIILLMMTLHLLKIHVESIPEDISDKHISEPSNHSTNYEIRDNAKKMNVDETTTIVGSLFTPPGLSTSNSIGTHDNENELNISDLRNVLQCVDYALCSYNKQFKVPVCYCDSLCLLYDDCCIDYHQENAHSHEVSREHDSKNPEQVSESSDLYKNIQTFQPFLSCSVWCYGGQYIGYQFVSACPGGTNEDLVYRCENNVLDVPMTMVPVSGANGIHFRNQFCAQCHNTSIKEYWELIIDDDISQTSASHSELSKDKLFHVLLQYYCRSFVIPPGNGDIRHCIKTTSKSQYNEYMDSQLCGRIRIPTYTYIYFLQRNTSTTISHFNRVAFFKNSACVPEHIFTGCIKGSDISPSDIINRHMYDTYSLSFLFQFDHLLQQPDDISCEKNKLMLTFLVSKKMACF